jgi:hypothetical protein
MIAMAQTDAMQHLSGGCLPCPPLIWAQGECANDQVQKLGEKLANSSSDELTAEQMWLFC